MDSMPHGRSLGPVFEISRPLLKPPWSTCLSAIDSNHLCQASMISGVGFSNPKCRNINLFIALSLLVVSLFHSSRDVKRLTRASLGALAGRFQIRFRGGPGGI